MALTLAELQVLTYRFMDSDADDTDNPKYPLAQVTAYLNAGQAEIVRRLRLDFFRKVDTLDASSSDITLPTDYLCGAVVSFSPDATKGWRVLERTTNEYLDEKSGDWDDASGQPTHYIVQYASTGTWTLKLYPAPTAAVVGGLRIRYTPAPTALSAATDTSKVTGGFPEIDPIALPAYAVWQFKLFEGGVEDDQVQKWVGIFEEQINRLRNALTSHGVGRSTYGGF